MLRLGRFRWQAQKILKSYKSQGNLSLNSGIELQIIPHEKFFDNPFLSTCTFNTRAIKLRD